MNKTRLLLLPLLISSVAAYAQNRIGTGQVQSLYKDSCASCHGENLEGNLAGSLLDDTWVNDIWVEDTLLDDTGGSGASDSDLFNAIKQGVADTAMPEFGESLSDEQIRSLVIFIRETKHLAGSEQVLQKTQAKQGVYQSELYSFRLEPVASLPGTLWSLDFMPSGAILSTERNGKLYLIESNAHATEIKGTPDVWQQGQGGLLDVALHPDYANNQWIYLSLSAHDGRNKNAGITKVVRGKIEQNQWVQEQTLFEVDSKYHSSAAVHFGSRFVFKDGYLFFSIGDRGQQQQAQDLTRPNGKIHRIHDDGRIPDNNPFVNVKDAYKSIWTYGNRNPQGLDLHPLTGAIWQTEHGPRGGDEVNLLEKGKNYGWPEITYGMNYSGTAITDETHRDGMEQPRHYWTPSIAVCGIDFYQGEQFPNWKHNLLVTGLASQELHRLTLVKNEIVADEIILKNQGRIRDVASGPDGLIYVILSDNSSATSHIQRLVPLQQP